MTPPYCKSEDSKHLLAKDVGLLIDPGGHINILNRKIQHDLKIPVNFPIIFQ